MNSRCIFLVVANQGIVNRAADEIKNNGLVGESPIITVVNENGEISFPIQERIAEGDVPGDTLISVKDWMGKKGYATAVFLISDSVDPGTRNQLIKSRWEDCRRGKKSWHYMIPLSTISTIEPVPRRSPIDVKGDLAGRKILDSIRGEEGPILIEGSSGVGKTETAYIIHKHFRSGNFRSINCASIQENLRESLFRGIEAGVATNVKSTKSVFEENHKGTVFLDDFQDLESAHQATLLDLLDPFTNTVSGHRLGGKEWVADVQVIIAINQPLKKLLHGKFRKDLSFRIPRYIPLPTLAEELKLESEQGDSHSSDLLRMKIIAMQERAIRLSGSSFGGLMNPSEILRQRLNLRWENGEGSQLVENYRGKTFRESTPIPSFYLTYGWPGNYRVLDTVARRLLRTSGKIGEWEIENAIGILKEIDDHESDENQIQEHDPIESMSPLRLIALAHHKAISESDSIRGVAKALGRDTRTATALVEKIARGEEQEYMKNLSQEELEKLRENCRRLDKRRRPSINPPS